MSSAALALTRDATQPYVSSVSVIMLCRSDVALKHGWLGRGKKRIARSDRTEATSGEYLHAIK